MDIENLLALTISLFLILNPFASIPMFLKVTDGMEKKVMASYANRAVLVATILLLVFVAAGDSILGVFGVTIDTFRVAGGVVFLMMAIEMIFGLHLTRSDNKKGAAWAVIASPVLTGPGVITAAVIASSEFGVSLVLVASVISLAATWVTLRLSPRIMDLIGEQALDILTKVMGLFIAAMGIQNMFTGSLNWFVQNMPSMIAIV